MRKVEIMPAVAIGRLYLEHVLYMLDGIHKYSTPLQIARKDGRIWSFLYLSFSTQIDMENAVKNITQFVSDNWAIYTKSPPFVCDAQELENKIFRVFLKNAPVDAYRREIVAYFERDGDLLAWDEMSEEPLLQGCFVNFIDLEHAMKYVRLSEKDKLYMHGVRMHMRPQRNLMFVIKLFMYMKDTGRETVAVEEVEAVAERFSMRIDKGQMESMMQCMPSIFKKQREIAPVETLPNPCAFTRGALHYTYRFCVAKESLLDNYSTNRIEKLEKRVEGMRDEFSWLFKHTACVLGKAENWDMFTLQHVEKSVDPTMDLPVCVELQRLVESHPDRWQVPDVVKALCTKTMRTAICLTELEIIASGVPALEVMEQNAKKMNLHTLVRNELLDCSKMRSRGFRAMLLNRQGRVSCALKAIYNCLDILTWNTFLTPESFECVERILDQNFFAIVNYRDCVLSNTK